MKHGSGCPAGHGLVQKQRNPHDLTGAIAIGEIERAIKELLL